MKYTSNQANKLLKVLEQDCSRIIKLEEQSYIYRAATTEDPSQVAPEYDFEKTQNSIFEIQGKIRKIKHAINMFNSTTILPGLDITIDTALILMPQLNTELNKLSNMKNRLPKTRDTYGSSSKTLIEYVYTNYDIEAASKLYDELQAQLIQIQTSLDLINNTVEFEINI